MPAHLGQPSDRWHTRNDSVVEAVVRGSCSPLRGQTSFQSSARKAFLDNPEARAEALRATCDTEMRAFRELEKVRHALESAQGRERALIKEVASLQEERDALLQKHTYAAQRVQEASTAHEELAMRVRKEIFCKGKLEREVESLRAELRDSKTKAKTTLKTLRERLTEVEEAVSMRHAQAQGPLQVLESCARRVRALVKTQPGQMSNGPYSAPTFWIRLLGDLDAAMLELEALVSVGQMHPDAHKSSTCFLGDFANLGSKAHYYPTHGQQQPAPHWPEFPPPKIGAHEQYPPRVQTLPVASQPHFLQAQLLQAQAMSRAAMEERDELSATNALLLQRLAADPRLSHPPPHPPSPPEPFSSSSFHLHPHLHPNHHQHPDQGPNLTSGHGPAATGTRGPAPRLETEQLERNERAEMGHGNGPRVAVPSVNHHDDCDLQFQVDPNQGASLAQAGPVPHKDSERQRHSPGRVKGGVGQPQYDQHRSGAGGGKGATSHGSVPVTHAEGSSGRRGSLPVRSSEGWQSRRDQEELAVLDAEMLELQKSLERAAQWLA